jgi:hypothetical protein
VLFKKCPIWLKYSPVEAKTCFPDLVVRYEALMIEYSDYMVFDI